MPHIQLCHAELISPMLLKGTAGAFMAEPAGEIRTLVPLEKDGVLLRHILPLV